MRSAITVVISSFLVLQLLGMTGCESTGKKQPAASPDRAGDAASRRATPADAASQRPAPADTNGAGLPGPALRARVDLVIDCWAARGAATGGHGWQRTGGLCNRTYIRAGSSGDANLSLVFPDGPDGSIIATEGFARFRAEKKPVGVELLVRVPKEADLSAYPQLELYNKSLAASSPIATLSFSRKELSALASPATLEAAFHAEIDRRADPSDKDLTRRQECRVLPPSPNLGPGETGRGQSCEWVETTAAERKEMADEMLDFARRQREWVTTNRDAIHALASELFPYGDPTCAARIAGP